MPCYMGKAKVKVLQRVLLCPFLSQTWMDQQTIKLLHQASVSIQELNHT